MPIYFYNIADASLNISSESYFEDIDLISPSILERCGDNFYIPINFPYKNLLKIYYPENANKLLLSFKAPTTISNFEVYKLHSYESNFYIVSFPKHYNFRIIGIYGSGVNTHIARVDTINKRITFINYSNFLERTITIRHITDLKVMLLYFNDLHLATALPFVSGVVNSLRFNIRKLMIVNPLVLFLNTQKSILNSMFLINKENNNVVDYVNSNLGNIPIYYPKFLFYKSQTNKAYKYNFNTNTFNEVSNLPITLSQLNSLGHNIEEIYDMDINSIVNFYGENFVDILLNGWIPPLIPIFNHSNKSFIYAKTSLSGSIESLYMGEVF